MLLGVLDPESSGSERRLLKGSASSFTCAGIDVQMPLRDN